MERHELLRLFLEEWIPFNRVIGLRLIELGEGNVKAGFAFAPQLAGDFRQGMLHGGVLATALDAVGAVAAYAGYAPEEPLPGIHTVDLRVDYLNPARGDAFEVFGKVLRRGRRLFVVSIELRVAQKETVCAMGTAVYRISSRTELQMMHP